MSDIKTSDIEYRGYSFVPVEVSPGWRVHIYPTHGLKTRPDHVWGPTQEEALTKARAIVDVHLSR